ncbi:MAG: aminotransferase class V-fold PLP-dependent enzyme [Candidatus Latescibacteria bacterium]|nr:aminotransferase class V-fold PLP-dependent enzyme [Candidatus Latescibacterota bacterium]
MDLPNIDAIRRSIPALSELILLNTAGIGPTPQPVLDRLTQEFTDITQHGPPTHVDPAKASERTARARARIGRFFGVTPEDVCFTQGVSDGFGIVINGLDWKPGDELIITDEEHPAFEVSALHLAKRKGIVIKRLALADNPEVILSSFKTLLTARTRLAALSHVTTDTGTRLPVESICRLCHDHGIPVACDGAQSAGQFPVDLAAMGVDFYCVLAYKWLLGPYGAGLLYVNQAWHQKLEVTLAGSRSARGINRSKGACEFLENAQRFEGGPISMPLFHAFAETLDFIESIGLDRIHALGTERAAYLREALQKIPGVTIQSPSGPATSTAIVAFSIEGKGGGDVSSALRAKRIVQRPAFLKFNGVRVSPAFFTSDAEIETLITAVREIAKK